MINELYSYIEPRSGAASKSGSSNGLQICIQPNLNVRGWQTEAGSMALKGYVALDDAYVIERLRAQGAFIAASTRMGELGFGLAGDTTGRAVQQDCDAALVTDAFGESRVIAALHGLLGFKPSHGVVSRRGLIGLIPSMESISVVAKKTGVVSSVLQAIVTPDDQDFSMMQSGLPNFSAPAVPAEEIKTVGVITEAVSLLDAAASKAFQKGLDQVSKKGYAVQKVTLPSFPLFRKAHQVIGSAEASSSAGKFDSVRYGPRASGTSNWNEMYLQTRAECFGTLLKCYLFQGGYIQFKDFEAFQDACRIRHRLVKEVETLFGKVDALALPTRRDATSPEKAETVEDIYDLFAMTLPANVLGTPAVSLPGFVDSDGVDLGLQLIAPRVRDRQLLEMAAALVG
ncbi:MAG TPA: amidase family protein [bacterium]|nr:amidase family protein [bacterium]